MIRWAEMRKPEFPNRPALAIGGPHHGAGAVTPYPPSERIRPPKSPSRKAEVRQYDRQAFLGTVHLPGLGNEEFRALDLSMGGVTLIGARRLGIGRTVEVAFLNRSMVVKGVIRAERESALPRWRIGIQFLQPQPELLSVALAEMASAG